MGEGKYVLINNGLAFYHHQSLFFLHSFQKKRTDGDVFGGSVLNPKHNVALLTTFVNRLSENRTILLQENTFSGLAQACSNSSVLAMELLQSYTKLLI